MVLQTFQVFLVIPYSLVTEQGSNFGQNLSVLPKFSFEKRLFWKIRDRSLVMRGGVEWFWKFPKNFRPPGGFAATQTFSEPHFWPFFSKKKIILAKFSKIFGPPTSLQPLRIVNDRFLRKISVEKKLLKYIYERCMGKPSGFLTQ